MLKEITLISYLAALSLGWVFGPRLSDLNWRRLIRIFIWVLYPCLNFFSITTHYTSTSLKQQSILPLAGFGIALLGFLLSKALLWRYRGSARKKATLGLLSTMGNYIFLPIPIATFLWGTEAAHSVILASLGGDLALWTLGMSFFQKRISWHKILNPPLAALLLAFVTVLFALTWPFKSAMISALGLIGKVTVPVAMFILGSQLGGTTITRSDCREAAPVVLCHSVIVPIIIWLLTLGLPLESRRILCLIAAMPSAIACVFITRLYDGDSALAARGILITHAAAALLLPLFLAATGLMF